MGRKKKKKKKKGSEEISQFRSGVVNATVNYWHGLVRTRSEGSSKWQVGK